MERPHTASEAGELVLGIGCERGTDAGLLERGIDKLLAQHLLPVSAVSELATLESKRDEAGILLLSQRRGWPLTFYSSAELALACAEQVEEGSPPVEALAASAREQGVEGHVGTPAVAEPAARLLAGTQVLLVEKAIYREPGVHGSMTLAVAKRVRAGG